MRESWNTQKFGLSNYKATIDISRTKALNQTYQVCGFRRRMNIVEI